MNWNPPHRLEPPQGHRAEIQWCPHGCSWFDLVRDADNVARRFILACLQQRAFKVWEELDGPLRLYAMNEDVVWFCCSDEETIPVEDLPGFVARCKRLGVLANTDSCHLASQFGGHVVDVGAALQEGTYWIFGRPSIRPTCHRALNPETGRAIHGRTVSLDLNEEST